jgi:DNA primase
VQDAARIEEVVGDFVTLKKTGSAYKACCPFHGEKTPSFTVSPSRGIFKCFGCGEGGDSLTFLQKQGQTFPEAVRHLAKKYGIQVEETESAEPDPVHDMRQQVRATLTAVQAHFSAADDSAGRKYWLQRGYTAETLDLFGAGYCAATSVPLVEAAAVQLAGIANEKGNLSHYKRATLPIHDHRGNLVSIVGRTLEEQATGGDKYMNGRTVEGVYNKGQYLYNYHRAAPHMTAPGRCG